MNQFIFEFILIGIVGGLLGIFYRNCLKVEDMIFYWWYVILAKWVDNSHTHYKSKGNLHTPNLFDKVLGFIAYPLGFCIYCSTTWITFFLCVLWFINSEPLPDWNLMVIGVLAATGVQHLIIVCACRFLIYGHPDLDV